MSAVNDLPGLKPDIAEKLAAGVFAGLLPHLHAVVAERAGELVLEHYDQGIDETWGQPLGVVSLDPTRCMISVQ